jgi:hypothetical protein
MLRLRRYGGWHNLSLLFTHVCACGFWHGSFVAAGEFGFFSKKTMKNLRFFSLVQKFPPIFCKGRSKFFEVSPSWPPPLYPLVLKKKPAQSL